MFPNAELLGCLFPLHKIKKKRVSNIGLIRQYNEEADFALNARIIVSLAFVTPVDLDATLHELAD